MSGVKAADWRGTLFGTRQRLEDHIDECGRLHRQLRDQLHDMAEQNRRDFAAMRSERDRMHEENGERVDGIDRTLMKVALSIVTAFLLAMVSQHI